MATANIKTKQTEIRKRWMLLIDCSRIPNARKAYQNLKKKKKCCLEQKTREPIHELIVKKTDYCNKDANVFFTEC